MPSCYCGRRFASSQALDQHRKDKRHGYCRICNRTFNSAEAVEQHRSALHCFLCPDCGSRFEQKSSVEDHQRAKGHCYCKPCDKFFVDKQALKQHQQSSAHATQFRCCDCERDFVNEAALNQHLADKVHLQVFKCRKCDRKFQDRHALEQHESSVVHKPLSNIKCIGDKSCKKRFSCPSAQLHHLESGQCRSGMTREILNAAIESNDTEGVISSGPSNPMPSRLLSGQPSKTSSTAGGILTPFTSDSDSDPRTPYGLDGLSLSLSLLTPEYSISRPCSRDGSGLRFSCFLCPPGKKPFRSPKALQDHLASPAHASKIFHCPVTLIPTTGDPKAIKQKKHFSTLSGLAQHLESGACNGGLITFRKVAQFVQEKLQQNGFSDWRLLN